MRLISISHASHCSLVKYTTIHMKISFFLPLPDLFPNLMDDNGEERESYLEGKSETWLVEVDWQPQHLIIWWMTTMLMLKRESRLKRKVAGATWLVEVDRQQQREALMGKFCCCDTLSEIGIFWILDILMHWHESKQPSNLLQLP